LTHELIYKCLRSSTTGVTKLRAIDLRDGAFSEGMGEVHLDPSTTSTVVFITSTLLAIGSKAGRVSTLNLETGVCQQLGHHVSRVTAIAADSRNVVSGGADTITQCWFIADSEMEPHSVPLFRGEIVAIWIASEFGFWVVGTADGAMTLIETRTGIVTRAIPLENNARPVKIIVTEEWGFILACVTEAVDGKMQNSLVLFSVNGELIRTRKIPAPVVAWTTFASEQGFDFVLMADRQGNLFFFEAFFLNIGDSIRCWRFDDPALAVHYVLKEEMVVLLLESGALSLFPFSRDRWPCIEQIIDQSR
jgi:hypothetical protein